MNARPETVADEFAAAVAATVDAMHTHKVRTVADLHDYEDGNAHILDLHSRVFRIDYYANRGLVEDQRSRFAHDTATEVANLAQVLANLVVREESQPTVPDRDPDGCPWGVSDILPIFAPTRDAHWTHTGGGCYAIEISAVELGYAGDGNPYILVTGEDVYTADDYDQIGGNNPHEFTLGLYEDEGDGEATHYWTVIGAHNLPRAVDSLFQLATMPESRES